MTREAAALGIPSYSIFKGPIGAVDQRLFDEGRIVHVGSTDAVDTIRLVTAPRPAELPPARRDLLEILIEGIELSARA